MTLTTTQLSDLKDTYVRDIMEGMDMKTMEMMVYEMLSESYESYNEEQLLTEIADHYDEEFLESLLDSITV